MQTNSGKGRLNNNDMSLVIVVNLGVYCYDTKTLENPCYFAALGGEEEVGMQSEWLIMENVFLWFFTNFIFHILKKVTKKRPTRAVWIARDRKWPHNPEKLVT